ncbi:hypothetical protein V8F06_012282 [Rhypophila decipiens]
MIRKGMTILIFFRLLLSSPSLDYPNQTNQIFIMSSRFRDANLCTTWVYNNTYNDSNVQYLTPRGPRSRPAGITGDVKAYVAAANWPLTEMQRWNLSGKASKPEKEPLPENVIITLSRAALTIRRSQPDEYTSDEKEWLKKRWGNEYSFLQAHGLNIYKDEHREEGIRIVRSLMSQEKNENESRGTTTKRYFGVSPFSVRKA